jgi:hypothetical protein
MIQTTDLVLLLSEMEDEGVEGASEQITSLMTKGTVSLDALRFVNEHRQLDVASFYERIRKNYNEKRSDLYHNIVKDIDDPQEVLTTLSALSLQILLYSKHVPENGKPLFFRHARAEEIARVLDAYYKDYDITSSMKLLRLIKADIKAFESIR